MSKERGSEDEKWYLLRWLDFFKFNGELRGNARMVPSDFKMNHFDTTRKLSVKLEK